MTSPLLRGILAFCFALGLANAQGGIYQWPSDSGSSAATNWGGIGGSLANQVDLSNALASKVAYRGAWNSVAAYAPGDMVVAGGYAYIALSPSTNTSVSNTTYWLWLGSSAATLPTVTGDVSIVSGTTTSTLATVNSGPGLCGDSTHVCQVTTNGKGLVTGQSAVAIAAGGSGTVSSVGLTAPSWLSVGGSPVTGSGTLALTAATGLAANQILATPNGTTGGVSLRSLLAADLPLISLTSGVSGTLPVGNGGTGTTTSTGSGNNVLSTSPTLVTPVLGTPTSITLTNGTGLPLTTGVTGILPVANGGTGTASPGIVAGTNVTVSGTWPNQTINSSGGGGASSWNGITAPTANETLAMGAFTSTWTWGAATGTNSLVTLTDTLNNTGTGYLVDLQSAAGSATNQIRIKSNNTTGVNINYTACSTTTCGYFGVAGPNKYPVGGWGGPGSTFVAADQDIVFTTGGGNGRWAITTGGSLYASNEVSGINIGQAGANRPTNIYAVKQVVASNFVPGVNTVTYSATPTFDLSLGDFQKMTLTGSVTSVTLTNMVAGQRVVFDFTHDATTTAFTVTMPSTVKNFAPIDPTTANKHNVQEFYSPDGTNLYPVISQATITIANGTAALGTSAIASGACATAVTVSATGVATTDTIQADFNGDPTGITGYVPSTNGILTVIKYPTANNVNFKVCNMTSASITPGAVTLNWKVTR
jgi:hypothetical protein